MNPEAMPPPPSPEQSPASKSGNYEVPPNYASLESIAADKQEKKMERSPVELAPQSVQPLPPVPPVLPTVPTLQPITTDDQTQQTTANPVAAGDDDLIEKEWVDRAKQVILETKDDPLRRERAIGELQRDYLMKRYGKQLGVAQD